MSQQKYIFITIGDTRTGKSSFSNQHSGRILAEVGKSNSISTTKAVAIHQNGECVYIDTMGFNDTNNSFSNKEIRERITDKICALGTYEAKIVYLIFESFLSDTVRLKDTLKNLEKLFGPTAIESAILVLTMHNVFADQDEIEATKKAIETHCARLKLKYLYWESDYEGYKVPTEIHTAQMKVFNRLANEVKSGSLDEVNSHRQYIQTEAKKRRESFKEFETKEVTVIEEREEPYKELVTRYRTKQVVDTIPYTEQEARTRTVTKTKIENYQETIQVQVSEPYSYKKRRGGLAGVFGGKKWVTGTTTVWKNQVVTKQRPVEYTENETYYVTVNKNRTNTRMEQEPYQEYETKYRKIPVPGKKSVQVEKPKPSIEFFIDQVKAEEKAKILSKYGSEN
jgi:hypothetical protein